VEAGGLGEGPEVAVAGDERDAAVDTGLRDEGVAEAGFAALRQDPGAESSCPLPMARFDVDQRQVRESGGHA